LNKVLQALRKENDMVSTTVLWREAISFASRKHLNQYRKDKETPYIAHPFRVAMTVRDVFGVGDPVALSAAVLHDVIEDTTADYDELAEAFGTEVAGVVAALTKDMRMEETVREAAYDRQLTAAPWQARLVKLADVYDNFLDCPNVQMKAKALTKARRAIACAGNDAKLALAVRELQKLIEQTL
jgi:guanosine-3',5'-bis(diphosphate) 3'-pyrophosphohydrolase